MAGRLIGYARVSTAEQDLDSQLMELEKHGCVIMHADKMSGSKSERPGLSKALAKLGPGDCLVITRLDRLGRSLGHLVRIVSDLESRGVGIRSLSDGAIDTTTASGKLIFHVFAALAEFERELIRERVMAGLAASRARGVIGGRRRMESDDPRIYQAMKLQDEGSSVAEICEVMGIHKATFYRWKRRVEDDEDSERAELCDWKRTAEDDE